MKCESIQLLIAEHATILRAGAVLSSIASDTLEKRQLVREDTRGIIEFLRLFASEFHQGKEESGLFTVFAEKCGKTEFERVRRALLDHEKDRSLIHGMEDAVLHSSPADFAKNANRLTQYLRTHIQQEEQVLFVTMERTLSAKNDERVLGNFQLYDQDFTARDRVLHRLRMLEWKYLRKAA